MEHVLTRALMHVERQPFRKAHQSGARMRWNCGVASVHCRIVRSRVLLFARLRQSCPLHVRTTLQQGTPSAWEQTIQSGLALVKQK
eukprot:4314655-Alexandrium_andersonii.AAC.1